MALATPAMASVEDTSVKPIQFSYRIDKTSDDTKTPKGNKKYVHVVNGKKINVRDEPIKYNTC